MAERVDHNDIVTIQKRLVELGVEIDRARQAARAAMEEAKAIRASIERERELASARFGPTRARPPAPSRAFTRGQ
jgi:hypothetical protein